MNLNIPVPKTPFFVTETATGQQIISREWYRFFTDMGFALGYDTNGVFDISLIANGPPAETVIAGFVQALASKILEADSHASQVAGMLESLPKQILSEAEILFGGPHGVTDTTPDVDDTSWVPVTDGAEPPTLISDGAGNLIFVAWHP